MNQDEIARSDTDRPASSRVDVPTVPRSARGRATGAFLAQLLGVLRFYSRLPVPVLAAEASPYRPLDFNVAAPWVAVAGALLGAIGGLILLAAAALGLPALLAATLATAGLTVITGAMHEDGLADTADGLFGGRERERRLAIMRDSRSGVFGVTALVFGLLLRVGALAALVELLGASGAALALVGVAATSRVAGLVPLWLLAPARADGAAVAVVRPGAPAMLLAAAVALAMLTGLCLSAGFGFTGIVAAAVVAALAGWSAAGLAAAKIGGQTGDVAGAAQQLAEIAMLIALVAAATPA